MSTNSNEFRAKEDPFLQDIFLMIREPENIERLRDIRRVANSVTKPPHRENIAEDVCRRRWRQFRVGAIGREIVHRTHVGTPETSPVVAVSLVFGYIPRGELKVYGDTSGVGARPPETRRGP